MPFEALYTVDHVLFDEKMVVSTKFGSDLMGAKAYLDQVVDSCVGTYGYIQTTVIEYTDWTGNVAGVEEAAEGTDRIQWAVSVTCRTGGDVEIRDVSDRKSVAQRRLENSTYDTDSGDTVELVARRGRVRAVRDSQWIAVKR